MTAKSVGPAIDYNPTFVQEFSSRVQKENARFARPVRPPNTLQRFGYFFKNTWLYDFMAQKWREGPSKHYFLTMFRAASQGFGAVPGNARTKGRQFQIPHPKGHGGHISVLGVRMGSAQTQNLITQLTSMAASGNTNAGSLLTAYNGYNNTKDQYGDFLRVANDVALTAMNLKYDSYDLAHRAVDVADLAELLSQARKVRADGVGTKFTNRDMTWDERNVTPGQSPTVQALRDWVAFTRLEADDAGAGEQEHARLNRFQSVIDRINSMDAVTFKATAQLANQHRTVNQQRDLRQAAQSLERAYGRFSEDRDRNSLTNLTNRMTALTGRLTFANTHQMATILNYAPTPPGAPTGVPAPIPRVAPTPDPSPENVARWFTQHWVSAAPGATGKINQALDRFNSAVGAARLTGVNPSFNEPPRISFPQNAAGIRLSVGDRTIRLNGRHYALMEDKGIFSFFEQVPDVRWTDMFSRTKRQAFREFWRSNYHTIPSDLWKFHGNLGRNRNRERWNQPLDAQLAFDRTSSNVSKVMTDGAGLTVLEGMLRTIWSKIHYNHEVTKIPGRVLAAAYSQGSAATGKPAMTGQAVAGYQPRGLDFDPNALYDFDELSPEAQGAVYRWMEYKTIPTENYQSMHRISPARMEELMKKREREGEGGLAAESLKDDIDYEQLVNKADSATVNAGNEQFLDQAPVAIVNGDGVMDMAQRTLDAKGNVVTYIPPGWKPLIYSRARTGLPTITEAAITRAAANIGAYKPFVNYLTDQIKRRDISLGQLVYEDWENIKGRVTTMITNGALDDPSEMATRWAAATGMTQAEATQFYIQMHQMSDRMDGDLWDRTRTALNNMMLNMDHRFKLEYLTAKDLEKDQKEKTRMIRERGKILRVLASDVKLVACAYHARKAYETGDVKTATSYEDEAIKHISDMVSSDVLPSTVVEINAPGRRPRILFNYLMSNEEALGFLYNIYSGTQKNIDEIAGNSPKQTLFQAGGASKADDSGQAKGA